MTKPGPTRARSVPRAEAAAAKSAPPTANSDPSDDTPIAKSGEDRRESTRPAAERSSQREGTVSRRPDEAEPSADESATLESTVAVAAVLEAEILPICPLTLVPEFALARVLAEATFAEDAATDESPSTPAVDEATLDPSSTLTSAESGQAVAALVTAPVADGRAFAAFAAFAAPAAAQTDSSRSATAVDSQEPEEAPGAVGRAAISEAGAPATLAAFVPPDSPRTTGADTEAALWGLPGERPAGNESNASRGVQRQTIELGAAGPATGPLATQPEVVAGRFVEDATAANSETQAAPAVTPRVAPGEDGRASKLGFETSRTVDSAGMAELAVAPSREQFGSAGGGASGSGTGGGAGHRGQDGAQTHVESFHAASEPASAAGEAHDAPAMFRAAAVSGGGDRQAAGGATARSNEPARSVEQASSSAATSAVRGSELLRPAVPRVLAVRVDPGVMPGPLGDRAAAPVEILVEQRGRDLHLTLHTADATLAGDLRGSVAELQSRMERGGFSGEAWASSRVEAGSRSLDAGAFESRNGDDDGRRQGEQGGDARQGHDDGNRGGERRQSRDQWQALVDAEFASGELRADLRRLFNLDAGAAAGLAR